MTDGFLGAGPDLGALEYGGSDWTTNVGWKATPPSPEPAYEYPAMLFPNQVRDGSFESGSLTPNWTTNAGSTLTLLSGSAWTDRRLRTGGRALQFNVGTSEIAQTVIGLLSNCSYKAFVGIQTTNLATTARFGVRNSGAPGSELLIPANTAADPNGAVNNSTMWKMVSLSFATGPTNTSAEIYLNVAIPDGLTPVYADDFGVETDTRLASAVGPYAPPLSPSGLEAQVANDSQIDLSWAASSGAMKYTVKRGTASGGPYTNVVTGVAATNYSDAGLSASTWY